MRGSLRGSGALAILADASSLHSTKGPLASFPSLSRIAMQETPHSTPTRPQVMRSLETGEKGVCAPPKTWESLAMGRKCPQLKTRKTEASLTGPVTGVNCMPGGCLEVPVKRIFLRYVFLKRVYVYALYIYIVCPHAIKFKIICKDKCGTHFLAPVPTPLASDSI